jgi:hypothetical protein
MPGLSRKSIQIIREHIMIVSQAHTIGVKEFLGTDEEGQVVRLAVKDFRHLVRASGLAVQTGQLRAILGHDRI